MRIFTLEKRLSLLSTLSRCLFMLLVLICLLVPAQRAESASTEKTPAVAAEEPVSCPAAEADKEEGDASPFYFETKASLYLIQLPNYQPVAVRGLNWPFPLLERLTTEDGKLFGVMPEVRLGWEVGPALVPQHPLTVEGSLFYTSTSNTQNQLFDYPATVRLGWYAIDGSQNPTGLFGGDDFWTKTTRKMQHWGGELLVAQEIPLAKGVSIRPYAGYSGMVLKQKFETVVNEVQAPPQRMELNEEVTGEYHGIVFGTKIIHHTDKVESYLSGSMAFYSLFAHYAGHQYSSAGSYTVDHTDTMTSEAKRLRFEAGSAYVTGGWKLGVNAGVEYLSAVPRIIASDEGGAIPGTPTHIVNGDSLAGKLGVDLSYSF